METHELERKATSAGDIFSKNKVAVITGAASGIGYALARKCVANGMQVVLVDLHQSALERAASELRRDYSGAELMAVVTDVSEIESMEALAEKVKGRFSKVNLLVNNAGVFADAKLIQQTPLEDWKWQINVNLWGVINGTHVFLPMMLGQSEPSHIVNTASLAAINIAPGLGAYQVSKFGVLALTETLAKELRGQQVGVSVMCPRFTHTGIDACESRRPEKFRVPAYVNSEPVIERPPEGDTAEHVARWIVEGVTEGRLYIFPENSDWCAAAGKRFETILASARPSLS